MKGDGLPKEIVGQSAILAFQAPDRLTISADYKGKTYSAGRNQQEVWVYVPDKKFGVIGQPGQPRFASAPEKKDPTKLGPFKLPLPKEQLSLLPLLMRIETQPEEEIEKVRCHVLQVTPKPEAIEALKIPDGTLKLWVRTSDDFPVRLGYADGKAINVEIQFQDVQFSAPWPAERWKLPAQAADKIETTALGHLTRFASVIISGLNQRIPPLGPSVGQRNGGNFPRKLRIRLKRPRLGI